MFSAYYPNLSEEHEKHYYVYVSLNSHNSGHRMCSEGQSMQLFWKTYGGGGSFWLMLENRMTISPIPMSTRWAQRWNAMVGIGGSVRSYPPRSYDSVLPLPSYRLGDRTGWTPLLWKPETRVLMRFQRPWILEHFRFDAHVGDIYADILKSKTLLSPRTSCKIFNLCTQSGE